MDNPVLESQDSSTGALNCSGSASLDLPPGVDRRRWPSHADRGPRLHDRGRRPCGGAQCGHDHGPARDHGAGRRAGNACQRSGRSARSARHQQCRAHGSSTSPLRRRRAWTAKLRLRQRRQVGRSRGLRGQRACGARREYGGAIPARAAPRRRRCSFNSCRATRDRFLAYRDRCPSRQCMADAYVGRMREIRDIMEGRLTPR